MNIQDPIPGCREAQDRLRALERSVLDRYAGEGRGVGDTEACHLECDALRAHAVRCPPCRTKLKAGLLQVERRVALCERRVPDRLLDGLFDAVREGIAFAPPGGGISPAFLDAPRSLRVWRATALAAMIVIGLGAGYVRNVVATSTVPARGEERLSQIPPQLRVPRWPTTGIQAPVRTVGSTREASAEHWFVLGGPALVPGGREMVAQEEHWD